MSQDRDFASVGAELSALDQLGVPELELLFQLECSGEDFYNALADRVPDDAAAELFRRNAKEELGHARRIQRALAIKVGEDYAPRPEMLERLPLPLPDEIPVAMLPFVVQGEIDGDAGYQRWADHEPDPAVARLLRLNGREETIHGERVTEAIALLEARAQS